jgi:hypothetical protein
MRGSMNAWEKVVANIDVTNQAVASKDISRMKEAILSRKSDLTGGSKAKSMF